MPKVGTLVRELRTRRRLNVRDLAARAGVSPSTISLLERDRISPSINTLTAISEALGTTLIDFLSGLEPTGHVSPFYRSNELTEIGDLETTGISYRVIGINHPHRQILLLQERYAPGADTVGAIAHKAQEAGVVISGRVEVTVGDEVAELGVGDGYYFDSRTPHKFRNISDGPSEIVSAVTPPSF